MFHSISIYLSGFDSLSLIWAAAGLLVVSLGIVVASTLRFKPVDLPTETPARADDDPSMIA
jgi:hypothetical protein